MYQQILFSLVTIIFMIHSKVSSKTFFLYLCSIFIDSISTRIFALSRNKSESKRLPSAIWACAFSDKSFKQNKILIEEAISSFGIVFRAEDFARFFHCSLHFNRGVYVAQHQILLAIVMIVFNGNRFNKFSLTIQSLNRTSIY